MTYETFDLEMEDGVAHLRFNRPEKANSMTPAFWRELPEAVNHISDTASARVIVISGEGAHFSSGMDISVFMEHSGLLTEETGREIAADQLRFEIKRLQGTMSALENARQPVLAAIQGVAIGGAIDLITACDCRYAAADAFFTVQETAIGMTADVGTFPRLAKIIPEGWARQMSYTAERVPAQKAKEIGLVNEVYETHEALMDGVMGVARQIAEHAPLAVTGAKRLINYSRDHSTADALDYISVWNGGMFSIQAVRESYLAKTEKRDPTFPELKPVKSEN